MRKTFFYLIIFVLAIVAGVMTAKDPGYALFAYSHWTLQMPLWVAGAIYLISFLIFYNLLLLIRSTGSLVRRVGIWRKQHKQHQSHRMTKRGLLELAEGKWASAENLLIKAIDENSSPLINYLAAARAAGEQGAYDRRDNYLKLAHESTPGSEVAVGLTQAQLQHSHKQLEHSLATLRHLQHLEPKHGFVLKMLKDLYIELNDWQGLKDLLPELKKRKVLKAEEQNKLETSVFRQLIVQCSQGDDINQLKNVWHDIPRLLRKETPIILAYANALHHLNQDEEAENILYEAIKHDWNKDYIALYGILNTSYPDKQLERAEIWFKHHGGGAALYLCLGRLSLKNQLWGKARTYLSQCLDLENNAQACAELAKLLEYLGEKEGALHYYRQGLMFSVNETELLSL